LVGIIIILGERMEFGISSMWQLAVRRLTMRLGSSQAIGWKHRRKMLVYIADIIEIVVIVSLFLLGSGLEQKLKQWILS
jgi:hypothetical protein